MTLAALPYALAGAALFGLGLHALLVRPRMLRKVLAVNLAGTGVFLLLVTIADRAGGPPDPVPHALVLTGIVVAVSATALALALIRRLQSADSGRDGED